MASNCMVFVGITFKTYLNTRVLILYNILIMFLNIINNSNVIFLSWLTFIFFVLISNTNLTKHIMYFCNCVFLKTLQYVFSSTSLYQVRLNTYLFYLLQSTYNIMPFVSILYQKELHGYCNHIFFLVPKHFNYLQK